MNKKTISDRNDLLNSFKEISGEFNFIKDDIKNRGLRVNNILAKLNIAIDEDPLIKSSLPPDHPLREIINNSLSTFKHQMAEWDKSIKNHDCNAEFRERYGDSLLIFVYGKVKSGKSSLGNYVAYGTSKPTPETITSANPKPHFFLETDTGKNEAMTKERMNEMQSFGVGSTETTSSIQGFTLPGLTWIDSPGIHSMTPVNGELAKDYANAADVIVFLSNSTSPARQSDLEEIIRLLKQKKPLIILITHSDCYKYKRDANREFIKDDNGEFIKDDNGEFIKPLIKPLEKSLQMKAEKDRNDQINYCQDELKKIISKDQDHLLDMRVYPISTAYVEADTDISRWKESGMGNFAQRLAEITASQGIKIKKSTPLNNLLSFFEQVNHHAIRYNEEVERISSKLQDEREQLTKDSEHILAAMRSELSLQIEKLADRHTMDNAGFAKSCKEALESSLQTNTETLLKKLGQRIDNFHDFSHLSEDSLNLPKFGKKTETVRYQSTVNSKRGKAVGASLLGLAATIGAAALTGGASLLVTAGVAAASALAAGAAGDKLGGMIGKQFDGNESMTVDIGDNRQEVSFATREQLIEAASTQLRKISEKLDSICFEGTENWLNNISASLKSLSEELNKQKTEITNELSAINQG